MKCGRCPKVQVYNHFNPIHYKGFPPEYVSLHKEIKESGYGVVYVGFLAPGVNNLSQWLLVTEIMSFKTITTSY